ncbi:MAG TPA: hypothetical protein PL002_13945 [Flavobacteriales bacterium]|nr:hypothetical protein [Flavobacteriales bacterium]
MTQGQTIAAELTGLQAATRTLLERTPTDKLTWKPHEKSMTLGRLAMHVAELPHWIVKSFELPEFDFIAAGFTPNVPTDHAQIMAMMADIWPKALAYLDKATDAAVDVSVRAASSVSTAGRSAAPGSYCHT